MPNPGDKVIVKQDCVCSRFTHESTRYPRDGFRSENKPEYSFKKGDEVIFISEWANFYGCYYRVQKEGNDKLFDIEIENFES